MEGVPNMRDSTKTTLWATLIANLTLCSLAAGAQPASAAAPGWSLPRGTTVRQTGARTYRFTIDYVNADGKGETLLRQHLSGDYTRGLPDGKVEWTNVTQADAIGTAASFGAPQRREFMSAFRYTNRLADTMRPEFFASFPPMAMAERNLVWDTAMIEFFGQEFFDHLELNVPFHVTEAHDVNIPSIGTFQNRDIVLEWIGRSRRDGQDCAIINYHAFLNPLQLALEGMKMQGRSEYWGQIWVAVASKQIEYATLYETVVGELQLAGQSQPQVVNVFRSGVLEPVVVR
jgi:hypothetical protein